MTVHETDVRLRFLTPEDANERYLAWLRDPLVTRYMDSRARAHSLEGLRAWVRAAVDNSDVFLFGVFLNNAHVGNVKIDCVNPVHRRAVIGLMLGEREVWGKGVGSRAIRLATDFAFLTLNLRKLSAEIFADNQASLKAFAKAGYAQAGRLKEHLFHEGRYMDAVLVEILRPDVDKA